MTFDQLEARRWDGEEWPEKRISLGYDGHSVAISPRYAVLSDAELNFEHIARCVNSHSVLVEALEQAVTSMLDSGYNPKSVVIRAAQQALDAAYGYSQ